MTTLLEGPAPRTATISYQPNAGFPVTFLGLMGKVTALLHQVDDARRITASGSVITRWDDGRTIWLLLCTHDYEVGRVSLDMERAQTVPAEVYAIDSRVEVRGVAHTHHRLAVPFIGARELRAA